MEALVDILRAQTKEKTNENIKLKNEIHIADTKAARTSAEQDKTIAANTAKVEELEGLLTVVQTELTQQIADNEDLQSALEMLQSSSLESSAGTRDASYYFLLY